MRKINLRAWDKREKVMGYLDEIWNNEWYAEHAAPGCSTKSVFSNNNSDAGKRDLVVMQSTGLRDRNGREIYEGDIVKYKAVTNENIGVVRFGEYEQDGSGGEYAATLCLGFFVERIKTIPNEVDIEMGWSLYEPDEEKTISILEFDLEIIGDIYQNPELLEEQHV